MRRRIGDIAIEVMAEENSRYIGFSTYGMLDEVYYRALQEGIAKGIGSRGGQTYRDCPATRQNAVLAALERDERFEKYYIRCCDRREIREILVRQFQLRGGDE